MEKKQTPEDLKKRQLELDWKLKENMTKIKHKILVLSNKGGVGKSALAINLACSLSKRGFEVGILDADLHGPSVAKMLGFEGQRLTSIKEGMMPVVVGPKLRAFSMASLLSSPDAPVIWRGPLKMTALKQFLAEVVWGELDYLIVDAPPGTGDEPLSICQLIPELEGGIVVTTPQDVALSDSRKCVGFLQQLRIPTLGILENMSGFICPHCGKNIDLFKSGGGEKAALELRVPFLGKIPFDLNMVKSSDEGKSLVNEYETSQSTPIFEKIVDTLVEKISGIETLPPSEPS